MEESPQVLEFLRPQGIVPALLVLAGAWVIARLLTMGLERVSKQWVDQRLALHQAGAILRLVVYLAGLAGAVSLVIELSQQALLAIGGTVAVAVGISLRDLVSSIIAGITILIDRPFRVGDRITYGSVYGEVVEIGLRTVRVVTLDDSLVTIPNNKFLTDVVSSGNAGELDMLVQLDLHIALDADITSAKRLVGEALASSRYAYLKKPWSIVVSQVVVGDAIALRLRAKVYVLDIRFEKALESDVTERVMNAFGAHGIAPPHILLRSDARSSVAAADAA